MGHANRSWLDNALGLDTQSRSVRLSVACQWHTNAYTHRNGHGYGYAYGYSKRYANDNT
jgi:hypothetical protein